jgi:integrase
MDMTLATGKRIGETCAITWDALDLDATTVEIRGTVIRINGHGLRIKPKPKSRG